MEPTKSARSGSGCRVGSARVPGWVVECLRLGVGHANTGRPDPSSLGVVGERSGDALGSVSVRPGGRGLPPIRLHDLRHSVASILLARGVHPKLVSELLGHATIALTLDTYSDVIPSLQQEAAGVVAAAGPILLEWRRNRPQLARSGPSPDRTRRLRSWARTSSGGRSAQARGWASAQGARVASLTGQK
jgi:hypothetical protein